MNNQKAIEKIICDNNILIENIKNEMNNNSVKMNNAIKDIVFVLKFKEENEKKEQYYNKVCDIICNLSNQINNCSNVLEISNLRKKLNYYTGKLKKELEIKNIDTLLFDNAIINYRNSISKYLRFIRRHNNIEFIISLNDNYENLTNDELNILKRLIKKEQSYNMRNLKNNSTNDNKVVDKNENIQMNKNVNIEKITKEKIVPNMKKEIQEIKISNLSLNEKNVTELRRFMINKHLNEVVANFSESYKFIKLKSYDESILCNSFTLVRNIPSIIKNKLLILKMKKENEFDDRELNGFIEYNRRKNSIRLALKEILNPRYRNSVNALILRDNSYCSLWLKSHYYYDKNKILNK